MRKRCLPGISITFLFLLYVIIYKYKNRSLFTFGMKLSSDEFKIRFSFLGSKILIYAPFGIFKG